MNYEEALAYLEGLIRFGIKLDLDRFRSLCECLDNPQRKFKSVHIGGTNGKGSTTVMTASMLRAASFRVGTYLSPYVHDVRERIQIDGIMIEKSDFARLMERIVPHLDAVAATDAGQPTEFEAKTLMAFLYFAEQQVDFACIEVGMGGRFDATNVLDPMVTIITNVSLDHMDRLGDTVEKIAFEKAGIIKHGTPVVTAAEGAAVDVIMTTAEERKARVLRVAERGSGSANSDVQWWADEQGNLSISTPEAEYPGLRLGMSGQFQYPNAACAVAAVEQLQRAGFAVGEDAIRQGLAEAYIPGRLEVLRESPLLVIDGAHNPDAAERLAAAVKSAFKYRRLILVIGMLSTHSAEGFLSHIAPIADRIVVTAPQWPLARPSAELASEAQKFCSDVEVVEPVQAAVDAALAEAGKDDLVLVTGSFYTIGEVKRDSAQNPL